MADDEKKTWNWKTFWPSTVGGVLTVAQILALFFVGRDLSGALRVLGYVLWGLSALFGWWPMMLLRQHGGVAQGEAYIHTTQLVDTGLYAVVRHPQVGTAWLLVCSACILIAQHELVLLLGLPAMAIAYWGTFQEDRRCIEKFGDAYRDYMARVPRVNAISGLIRLARTGRKA